METDQGTKDGRAVKKRPSKGFRACFECKRPKLYPSATSEINSGLGGMNTTTTTTENAAGENHCAFHLGERLGKLEQLFEKFVCRKSTPGPSDLSRSPTLTESSTSKQSKLTLGDLSKSGLDSTSIASTEDGTPSWHTSAAVDQPATQQTTPSLMSYIRSFAGREESSFTPPDCDAMHKQLAALLPSQHDANVIFESTNGWMLMNSLYKPNKDLFVHKDPQSYALDMATIAREHVVIIARTLLHLAVCISALPPTFDTSRLLHIWSLEGAVQNYVSTVTSLVTTSDEILCTLPGLETLLLLTIYHLNMANLRQSWLIVRRTMNLAQLMGFHRIIGRPTTSPPIEAVENAKLVWRAIVDVDTYLGLHLRLPFGTEQYPYGSEDDRVHKHRVNLCSLSREISYLDREITPHSYVQALALDEKLESLMKSLSKEFWDVPNVPSTARSPESAAVLERLVQQIWHFELKIFVHLPFLLRAPYESRYEYSKISALQASRNVIMRWFALRNASITQACCRFAELGVFIATVTIGMDILIEMGTKEKSEVQKTRGSDFAMVCRVISEMEKLAKASPREKIAHRSAVVIKKLMCSLDPNRQGAQSARLTIPYFGTIEIAYHQQPVKPPFSLESESARKINSQANGTHVPVFSFVRHDLWPTTEEGWGADLDFDIILFDGLEDRDTEGNWMF